MIINTKFSKFNKRKYLKDLRKQKGSDVEVYKKKKIEEGEDPKGRGRPKMETANKLPDLSCPDRNPDVKITKHDGKKR